MRHLLAACLTLLLCTTLTAQKGKKKTPPPYVFGTVEKADLEMKHCEFDEKAEAVVLIDDGVLDCILGLGMEMKRTIRIKILSDEGLDWANVHLQFFSEKNAQEISGLEAQTYNLDNSGNIVVTKLDKKLIYEKKINKKYSEKVFTFPAVKVGSIIEYKFKKTGIGLLDWYFQRSIPVQFSRFKLDFPLEINVHVTPHCSREFEQQVEQSTTRMKKTYVMHNVPGFRDEPFIMNEDYYRDRLETKITSFTIEGRYINRVANWVQVIKVLMDDEDFGVQVKKNIPRTADLDAKLKTLTDPYQKMKIIHKYVQSNMQWNDYTGIWALDGVKSAWKDKKGTVGEINLILVNLLKDANLQAYPVLVSTHENGIVNTSDAGTYDSPGFEQFDKVMAYVEIGDKSYVLDATDKITPPHLFPPEVVATEGLVISRIENYEWGWRDLWKKELAANNMILLNAIIDSTGKLSGEITITSSDYARFGRLVAAKKGKDKYTEQYITANQPDLNIEEIAFENIDDDSLPLVQKIKFTKQLNAAGDYHYFTSNILTGLEKNPFVADTRFSDVFFGHNQSFLVIGNFSLPDGYELEALPKNIRMIMPDTSISISRISQKSDMMLMTQTQVNFKKPIFRASEYPALHDFYQELDAILNEQFVIRKKK